MTQESYRLETVRAELHMWLTDVVALKPFAEFGSSLNQNLNSFAVAYTIARRRAEVLAEEYARLCQPR